MTTDHFAHKAGYYDLDKDKRDNVTQIGKAICSAIQLSSSMQLMDFGSGTGLLLECIAPYVGKITAVDVSQAMNAQLREKLSRINTDVEIVELDLESNPSDKKPFDRKFDGIISSMTMHHIKNISAMIETFYSLLKDGGFIAIADLDREDGDFHGESHGVYHAGFDREYFVQAASKAGFKNVAISTASVINKSQRDYPVFLLTGYR
jgi:cyclopropane fatty-acyl-phospholipid synthase-like methyltransferase